MDTQPDFKQLSGVFITASTLFNIASREIARISNVPTFNDGQRLFEAINSLITTVKSKFITLEAKVIILKVKVITLAITIDLRFSKLENVMSAELDYLHFSLKYYTNITLQRSTAQPHKINCRRPLMAAVKPAEGIQLSHYRT